MEQIWWERVPNALFYINSIVDSLTAEKSILLYHSKPIPWRNTFLSLVKDTVKQQNYSKTFDTVTDVADPGAYLLQKYCKAEKRAQYRPSKGYASFLAESNDIVLHERFIWIEAHTEEQVENWAIFISDYVKLRSKDTEPAVFVLEFQGNTPPCPKKGVSLYSFDDYIGEYDRMVYAVLAASVIKCKTYLKKYLVELAVNVIGSDTELYTECFRDATGFMNSPYTTIMNCVYNSMRSDGTTFTYTRSQNEVDNGIWLSQIKAIYPDVEKYRKEFVQSHHDAIEKQLPLTSNYGEVYSEARDVELGTLSFLANNGNLPLSHKDYEELWRFKTARNRLSHQGTLTLKEICSLYG